MWLVVKVCRSEKTASGTARVTESSQIIPARKPMLRAALDLLMSSGLTIALYLEEETAFVNEDELSAVSSLRMQSKTTTKKKRETIISWLIFNSRHG